MIVTIDPGLHHTGVAIWDHHLGRYFLKRAHLVTVHCDNLAETAYLQAREAFIGDYPFEAVIVELPQVYTRDKSKGDPNDLIAVAAVAGAIMDHYIRYSTSETDKQLVLPFAWKGNVPKETKSKQNPIKNRCVADLVPQEMGNVVLPKAVKIQHNVWDAVGLGLWYLKKNKLRSASPSRSMQHLSDKHVN